MKSCGHLIRNWGQGAAALRLIRRLTQNRSSASGVKQTGDLPQAHHLAQQISIRSGSFPPIFVRIHGFASDQIPEPARSPLLEAAKFFIAELPVESASEKAMKSPTRVRRNQQFCPDISWPLPEVTSEQPVAGNRSMRACPTNPDPNPHEPSRPVHLEPDIPAQESNSA